MALGHQGSVPLCLYLDEALGKCVFWGIYLGYVWISLWLFFYQARLRTKGAQGYFNQKSKKTNQQPE